MQNNFYTQFNRPKKVIPVYYPEVDDTQLVVDNNVKRVKVVGKTNFQERIEACCGYHSVKQLIERAKRGDVDALNSRNGFYADISKMPTSLVDAHAISQKSLEYFNNLDKGLQKAFGNFDNFLKSFSDGSFATIIGGFYAQNKKVSSEDNKDDSVSSLSDHKKVPSEKEKQNGGK